MSDLFGAPVQTGRDKSIQSCRQLMDAGQYDTAVPLLRELVESEPRNPVLLRMLGYALVLTDRCPEGIRHLELASKLLPDDPDILCDLSMGLRRLDRLGEAHRALDKVLAKDPSHPRAVAFKARLLQSRGQTPKAMEIVRAALAVSKNPVIVTIFGNLSRELKEYGPAIDLVREALQDPALDLPKRTELYFALGHLLDGAKEYDDAFAAFDAANKMSDPGSAIDFDAHMNAWSKETIGSLPRTDLDASRCVLVVGMPRSGTTLTEQVLGAHPNAGGVGESPVLNEIFSGVDPASLDLDTFKREGNRYLTSLKDAYPDPKVLRVVDKMPENHYYLGGVSRMLPGVKVINCRRDPRDTCLSIYFQRFGPGIRYANNLRACAEQYLGYRRLIDHWREVTDLDILDSHYEKLTSEPEPSVRALLDHIGLDFNKACLSHHKSKSSVHTASAGQVRQPLYTTSTARWKRYEKHLGPMLEVLGEID